MCTPHACKSLSLLSERMYFGMSKIDFSAPTSVFSDEMRTYFAMKSYYSQLKIFDQFCIQSWITAPVFTMNDVLAWSMVDDDEGDEGEGRYCTRLSVTRNFLVYLNAKSYDVVISASVPYKESDFKPYIYCW